MSATGLVCPYGCRVRMWTLASAARWRWSSDAVSPMTAGITGLLAELCSIPARLWARSMSVSSMVTEASATRYVRSPASLFAETMMLVCPRSSASLSVMSWAVRALLIISTRNGAVSCRRRGYGLLGVMQRITSGVFLLAQGVPQTWHPLRAPWRCISAGAWLTLFM